MIVLFTDFGSRGPYTGQMKAVLAREAPGHPVVDLFADAPAFNPRASAYLLATYAAGFAEGSVFLAVVDPGVGTRARRPAIVQADGVWFVGPDNGLFHVLAKRARARRRWEVLWRPALLSASFHGRDLFAPVAADLACGRMPEVAEVCWTAEEFQAWPDELGEIVYVDGFGNGITGIRARALGPRSVLSVNGYRFRRARTFGEVRRGKALWYENSSGLAEVAVSSGSAAKQFGLAVGQEVRIEGPES